MNILGMLSCRAVHIDKRIGRFEIEFIWHITLSVWTRCCNEGQLGFLNGQKQALNRIITSHDDVNHMMRTFGTSFHIHVEKLSCFGRSYHGSIGVV